MKETICQYFFKLQQFFFQAAEVKKPLVELTPESYHTKKEKERVQPFLQ